MFSIQRLTLGQSFNSHLGPAPYDTPRVIISAALTLRLDKNYTKTPVAPAQISQHLGIGAISRLYRGYIEGMSRLYQGYIGTIKKRSLATIPLPFGTELRIFPRGLIH